MSNPVAIWRNKEHVKKILNRYGVIVSWTSIKIAPPAFQEEAPYLVVLVKLDDDEMVYGQLSGLSIENIFIGQRVKSVLRRSGKVGDEDVINYSFKFVPVR